MSWKLLAAGLIFLFNPCVNVIDPLPDAVGCLLIMAALRRASVVSADAEAARRRFGTLAAVSAGKLVAALILTAMRSNVGTLSLALSFAAATVELVFFISAFRALFAYYRAHPVWIAVLAASLALTMWFIFGFGKRTKGTKS